jgi:hypothetical protein
MPTRLAEEIPARIRGQPVERGDPEFGGSRRRNKRQQQDE